MLAIETATPGASVALVEDRTTLAAASRIDRVGHASFLVPAIDFCFDQVGWSPEDLDAVVVDVGPGLYTGIRVGVATAQGLGAAFGIPILPATSVDAVALEARTGHRLIWSVVDVRRGEYAVARYRPVPGGVVKEGSTDLLEPEVLRASLVSSADESLVVGDVSSLPDGFFLGMSRVKTGKPRYPYAVALAEIGHARLEKGDYPAPDEIRPLYMRDPDVTINWAKLRREGPWGPS
ncbi:MAG: tRNA (adenosine(37)-N6)-threonylcarbamoyltransferase complex dimerization subunit type 1 TsaB [Actinobacteria bacterium]|nr:tRNA (adenosine(37)-N6)-threonylcarbamoyltransferase complex dimerization subunit type 1 TsaB [Actinomycetota bacterium]MCI0544485.1 tRNA (adenosine(37)-N6)-threonylcarbamoyltransferase complex dimerization subunit type 1 TsaB [Actinomycetota bacterium]